MLYVLPPPSAPNSPSPWNSILCASENTQSSNNNNNNNSTSNSFNSDNSATWSQRPPIVTKGRFPLKHRGGLQVSFSL